MLKEYKYISLMLKRLLGTKFLIREQDKGEAR